MHSLRISLRQWVPASKGMHARPAASRFEFLAGHQPIERGQALVEFALVMPLLVFFLMGMFDLGRGVYAYNVVASAAREGARFAIVKPGDTSGIQTQAFAVAPALDHSQLTMDSPVCKDQGGSPSACSLGNNITITVHYRFQPITAFFATVNLVGKSTMMIE